MKVNEGEWQFHRLGQMTCAGQRDVEFDQEYGNMEELVGNHRD